MTLSAVAYLRPPGDGVLDPEAVPSGLEIVSVVLEDDATEPSRLGQALQWLAAREADALFVARLSAAAGTLGDLVRLLDWLEETGAVLVAADVGLNTGDRTGRRLVALLREIERWGREPGTARRPRGRPGLSASSPELVKRIALMRERGLSLQAIAFTLNAEGVPTPRGGAQWRPSSVQSALGYRRPRLPVLGAPPPPKAGKHGPPRAGKHAKPPKPPGPRP